MSADREALRQCLDNWHAHQPIASSPRNMGRIFVLLVVALAFAACLALLVAAAEWLEEDGDDCASAVSHIVRAQGGELQAGREGQDVGHGAHGAGPQGGRA